MHLLRRLALVFLGFLGLLSLAGCRAAATPAPTFAPQATPTAAASATPSPTVTATPSPSPQPSATPLPTPTPLDTFHTALSRDDQAAFVSETVNDYTTFAPGEAFTKTWTLRNTGETTWTTDYALVRGASVPAGADWGAPVRIPLPHSVAPDEEITFSADLTAPSTLGTYTLHWSLVNAQGEIVPVDGGRSVWVLVRVCAENLPCPTPQASFQGNTPEVEVNGVTARLLSLTADAQQTIAQLCMTTPNNHYLIQPPVILQVDNQPFAATSGGTLGPATSPTLCYMFAFPVTETQLAQASRVAVIIQQVRMSGFPNPDERCQIVHDQMVSQYPGLDFTCHFSMAGYFTDLHVPEGMHEDRARQRILDAIEGAIDGPWVLRVR